MHSKPQVTINLLVMVASLEYYNYYTQVTVLPVVLFDQELAKACHLLARSEIVDTKIK